jgi:signal transduction histidine kinase
VEVEVVSNVYRVNDRMIIQCNLRDVTARKRAEAMAKQATEATEAASRAKDRFLATLSHELRTPLTPVLATIAYVEMMPGLPVAELREHFISIRGNVELEAQLIDDLLDVTRIGSGKLELHQEVVDIHAALRTALEVCQAEVEAKKLVVSLALGAEVRQVWADPARMQQVFWNLIKNAVKFTPVAGHISLRSADVGVGRMAIEVADTGIGIEPEALCRIFDAFEQGDQSVTRRHGGLGLGLAIAKQLVELHGGSIRATSGGEGLGSTFSVELPLSIVQLEDERAQRVHPTTETASGELTVLPRLDGVHVFVVDDEPDARELLRRVLEDQGAQVTSFGSAESVLEALKATKPTVLVSDIGMPGMDGYQLIRALRAGESRTGRLAALALTAFARAEDRKRSLVAGYQTHLAKPFDVAELVLVIAGLVGR